MERVNRGEFLGAAAAAGTAWLVSPGIPGRRLSAQSTEARIDVLLNEPVGTVKGSGAVFRFPPASVTRLTFTLG